MTFDSELKFEKALIEKLTQNGWETQVLKNKTEDDLIQNWADILYKNNRDSYRLGNYPLTKGEMNQILEKVRYASPYHINKFVNGKTISIIRDNKDDINNYGREISLKIYDRDEIAAGISTYQIVEQPIFRIDNPLKSDRRGDLLLLINGMPLIHIELKRSGVSLSEATNQIKKYKAEQCFTGLFNMVQIFVAMTPEEMVYFANPGDGEFNEKFFFHYADINNDVINDWRKLSTFFLNIPMAHELIGFYTVAESDGNDRNSGTLKVMRSYQIYAARAIAEKVRRINRDENWGRKGIKGGYIWHTTGSGKTLTSFKTAQLIANSKDADKVIFLVDRIELSTQSLNEYRNFAEDQESVQNTTNTYSLISKLKSNAASDSLIVTSIQKMNRIDTEYRTEKDLEIINNKRLVFIVDECHRSTFGDMFVKIKQLFKNAVFFGFTGTPIQEENMKSNSTTVDIFGDELHRYTIVDGIKDKSVLGFDYTPVITFDYKAIRKQIALQQAKVNSESEAFANPEKEGIFLYFNNPKKFPNAGYRNSLGKVISGLEDLIHDVQYKRPWDEETSNLKTHKNMVVSDILKNWQLLSMGRIYSAIMAVSSIPEAIIYYRLFKLRMQENPNVPQLKITCLFDPNIDNVDTERSLFKEDGKAEILEDYNANFDQCFMVADWDKFKKDVANRLAHKGPYIGVSKETTKRLDLLIVVDQMLTGYDSKYVNTLYLDKVLEYSGLIQAFSRTNRIETIRKESGNIKFYKKPYTMVQNIEEAFKVYSGNKASVAYVDKIGQNILAVNSLFKEISQIFTAEGIHNFEKNPESKAAKAKFASEFNKLWRRIQAATLQGFNWEKVTHYTEFDPEEGMKPRQVSCDLERVTYDILIQRYNELKELAKKEYATAGESAYDVDATIIEMDATRIDKDYLEEKFTKWTKVLQLNEDAELVQSKLQELQSSFATLPQDEQSIANSLIFEIQSGDLSISPDKSFRDYINERKVTTKTTNIHNFALAFGLPEQQLNEYINYVPNEDNYNDFSRFDKLVELVDRDKAKAFLEAESNSIIPTRNLFPKLKLRLKNYILDKEYENKTK
ncbi:type I restriction endonuclease subunit R [Mycoplasma sp. T193]|uniref:type I restriction endonuclease subunit R n=1 Tax=Mycoplasma sp. T193 TaxID=3401666 RepID=UPI003AB09CFA